VEKEIKRGETGLSTAPLSFSPTLPLISLSILLIACPFTFILSALPFGISKIFNVFKRSHLRREEQKSSPRLHLFD